MHIDTTDFDRTMRKYLTVSTRSLTEAINEKMFFILDRAQKETPLGDRAKIEAELGATTTERLGKTGKVRRKISYRPTKLVYKLVNRKTPGLTQTETAEAAKKLIAARLRAVGSLRAGWSAALRKFGMVTGRFGGQAGLPRVKRGSEARPATDGLKAQAEAVYNLLQRGEGGSLGIDSRVETALSSAFASEARSMESYLERKLGADWRAKV